MTCEKTLSSLVDVESVFVKTDTACVVAWAEKLITAVRREQCGQGVFCRDAAAQVQAIVHDISEGRGTSEDMDMLHEVSRSMKQLANCSMAAQAAENLLVTLETHRDEWEAHIRRKRCNAGVCPKLESGQVKTGGGLKKGLRKSI